MTSVEHISMREKLEQFRQEFDRLNAEGKISARFSVLFKGMYMFTEMMVTLLERDTSNISANSSLPSSMTPSDKAAKSRPGRRSKGDQPDPEPNPNTHTEVSQETT